jgi:hypothetical protein
MESRSVRASTAQSTAVLPFLTEYLGPRTGLVGLTAITGPTKQPIEKHAYWQPDVVRPMGEPAFFQVALYRVRCVWAPYRPILINRFARSKRLAASSSGANSLGSAGVREST